MSYVVQMFGYAYFNDNSEFTRWQEENPNCQIMSISPCMQQVKLEPIPGVEEGISGGFVPSVFVTYSYKEEAGTF